MSQFNFKGSKNKADIIQITKALGSETRYEILKLLKEDKMDYSITDLAKSIGQTEANISSQVRTLEKVGLVQSSYKAGTHGVLKIV